MHLVRPEHRLKSLWLTGLLVSLALGISAVGFAEEKHPPEKSTSAQKETAAPKGGHGTEGAEKKDGHAEGGHGEHKQEGPITAKKEDADLAVWSLITFAVFVFVLGKFAWGPIVEGLEKREQGVLQNIADAETARLKAEKLLADHTEKLDRVQNEVREILAEARRDAEHTKADIVATAQKEAEATKSRAVAEINQARDAALDSLFDHMSKAVSQATETVLGRSVTGADQDRLIQDALRGVNPSRN